MQARSIFGVILIGLGIGSLAYFASPLRLVFQETFDPHTMDPLLPVLGGVALVCGIILLFAGPRANKEKREP